MTLHTAHGPLELIYEDSSIVVVSKPHGLHTVDDRNRTETDTIRSVLDKRYGKIFIVHRLDAGTGGVMICAKTAAAHSQLCQQFEHSEVEKSYLAVTNGVMQYPISIFLPISGKPNKGMYKINFTSGKPAQTTFMPICNNGEISLVRGIPFTGRTHQIRVHLRGLKTPLKNDWLYNKLSTKSDRRLTLFAESVSFTHPESGERVKFTAKLSDYMRENMAGLTNIPNGEIS